MTAATHTELETLRAQLADAQAECRTQVLKRQEVEAREAALTAHLEEAKRIFEEAPEIDPHPHGWVLAVDIAAAQDWIDATPDISLARRDAWVAAEAVEAAINDELPRVSHLEYDSHEICKHFGKQLVSRLRRQAEEEE